MPTVQIALSDEEYERLRCLATDSGESADAAAQKILRTALSQPESAPAEKLLRAVEAIHQQYGTPHTTDTTAIIRELRQTE